MLRKVTSGIAMLMAAILLYTAFSSWRDDAMNAGHQSQQDWQVATDTTRSGDDAKFDRYMAERNAVDRERDLEEKGEAVAGVVFLIAALVLFKSSKPKGDNNKVSNNTSSSV